MVWLWYRQSYLRIIGRLQETVTWNRISQVGHLTTTAKCIRMRPGLVRSQGPEHAGAKRALPATGAQELIQGDRR
jgi:hypothetical protein